jgi:hypothetical protein
LNIGRGKTGKGLIQLSQPVWGGGETVAESADRLAEEVEKFIILYSIQSEALSKV